jgi:hypothetical protein
MKRREPESLESLRSKIETALGMKISDDTTLEEIRCWMKARIEDLQRNIEAGEERDARIFRKYAVMPPSDSKLFRRVLRGFRADITIGQGMTAIRVKKRRGRLQEKALEIWDRHYAKLPYICLSPSDAVLDQIFYELERQASADGDSAMSAGAGG